MSTTTVSAAATLAELQRIDTEISTALAAMREANDTVPCDHAKVAVRCQRLEDLHMAQADTWWHLSSTRAVSDATGHPASADVVQLLAKAAAKAGNDAAEQSRAWRTHAECAWTATDARRELDERAAAGSR